MGLPLDTRTTSLDIAPLVTPSDARGNNTQRKPLLSLRLSGSLLLRFEESRLS